MRWDRSAAENPRALHVTMNLYPATDFNRDLAALEIDKITCDNKPFHLPAILEALSLLPDALNQLTDAEPDLSPFDLGGCRFYRGAGF